MQSAKPASRVLAGFQSGSALNPRQSFVRTPEEQPRGEAAPSHSSQE